MPSVFPISKYCLTINKIRFWSLQNPLAGKNLKKECMQICGSPYLSCYKIKQIFKYLK